MLTCLPTPSKTKNKNTFKTLHLKPYCLYPKNLFSLLLQMAPSLSSSLSFQSKQISSTRQLCNIIYVSFLILLLAGSSFATRPGTTMVFDDKVSMTTFRRKHETGFRYQGQLFNFFPKGTPIPPSGPSKRHNSVVDSTQN